MLDCRFVFERIREQDIRFFSGVPDSLLKNLCAYISDHTSEPEHVIAANEGNAVALAIGHYLGSGQPALVYMQNSGIGNAVNPLLSLADPDVYSIPVLLVIGWRGEPGHKDEPQHVKQGRIMTELFDAMEIPWYLLPDDADAAAKTIAAAGNQMRARMGPVAIIVSAGTFGPYDLRSRTESDFPMNREETIKRILGQLDEKDIVVSTTGKASREVYEYRQASRAPGIDFLTVGGMGHTASIAMGIGRAQPDRRVVCLDGDGSAIMHMGALGIIGNAGPANLLHVVVNNGAHDSVGGQPTVGYGIDISAIAAACGYRETASVTDPDALEKQIRRLRTVDGPVLLEVRVNKGGRPDLGRPASTPVENRDSLMSKLGV
jgi:phosphonopyruvate decarboxylase